MEPSGRNPSQSVANGMPAKRLRQAKTVAVGCDQLPESFHGKDGVAGSIPAGLHQADDQRKCWSSWRSMRYLPSRETHPMLGSALGNGRPSVIVDWSNQDLRPASSPCPSGTPGSTVVEEHIPGREGGVVASGRH